MRPGTERTRLEGLRPTVLTDGKCRFRLKTELSGGKRNLQRDWFKFSLTVRLEFCILFGMNVRAFSNA